jgi:hypothetical protein
MDDLQKIVLDLLANKRCTHQQLADLVPCSSSQIGMLAIGARGKRTSYHIENRLRELHNEDAAVK